MKLAGIFALGVLGAGPAFAEAHVTGDAAAGETAFRQCVSCHVVQNDEGEVLAGRRAKTGPNLYGVALRPYGALDDYRYSDDMAAAGEAGNVWAEAAFVAYVQDPTGHLREVLDDPSARGKMTYRLRKEADAFDIWAYLVSLGPELTEEEMEQLTAAGG